jgi:hypothetical protein
MFTAIKGMECPRKIIQVIVSKEMINSLTKNLENGKKELPY